MLERWFRARAYRSYLFARLGTLSFFRPELTAGVNNHSGRAFLALLTLAAMRVISFSLKNI